MADAVATRQALSIVRIRGWCVGGACFSIPEVDLDIPLALGDIERLVREIGPARTKELVITCREFKAAEAQQRGFINPLVEEASLEAPSVRIAKIRFQSHEA